MHHLLRVVTGSESAARDAIAMRAGVPSRALMQRAGAVAAAELALRVPQRLASGVVVLAGPGNNGGDAWVVARALASTGIRVRVVEPLAARTDDCRAERALFAAEVGGAIEPTLTDAGDALVVDGLLGTGATGAPRGEMAAALEVAARMRARGAFIAALDLPSGLDANDGSTPGVTAGADLTLSFGTFKRGHLMNRDVCGVLVALDIGLLNSENGDALPTLVDERWVAEQVPHFSASAHKGTRKKIVIVGGAAGMAGAAILAARAAARTGAGMVKLVVASESRSAVQEAEPAALATEWPRDAAALERDIAGWADALVMGPGLGRVEGTREMIERVLSATPGLPVLLDADALNAFAGEAAALEPLLSGRRALITPHAVEFARLSGLPLERVLSAPFDVCAPLAAATGACVLLKGVPTVVAAPDGARLVSAEGTPALATAGSGDVLSGICGTLLAQLGEPLVAGAAGAWIHGRSGARASAGGVRGATLDDVLAALARSWDLSTAAARYPVLAELPAPVDGPGREDAPAVADAPGR